MVLNHYQILGIPENADSRQIKAAYRSLAKRCHPDTNHGSEAAAELFRQLNEAYRILGNEQLRKAYDQKIAAQKPPPKPEPAKPKPQPKTADRPDPQQKFNNFLYSVLGAILETPDQSSEIRPRNKASPTAPKTRKTPNKPDFNFYYYLARERESSPYTCGEDGIYRRTRGNSPAPTKRRTFNGVPGASVIMLLLSGLWEFIKQ